MFPKKEKVCRGKKNHLISSRNDAMQALWGPYVMVVERLLYAMPQFAQTWNHHRFGEFHDQAYQSLGEHYALNIDHTAFDAHVDKDLLDVQDYFFKKLLGVHAPSDDLFRCLAGGLCTYWKSGRIIRLLYMRFSGDMHTSCGNGILSDLLTRCLLRYLGIPKHDVIYAVKGDDSDIRVRSRCSIEKIESFFKTVGMVAKVKIVPWYLSEFASIYYLPGRSSSHGFRVPWKILTRVPYLVGRFRPAQAFSRSLGVATCEYLENAGCPILGALSNYWFRHASAHSTTPLFESEFKRRQSMRNSTYADITDECRLMFERIFGIPAQLQREVESRLDGLHVGDDLFDHPVWDLLAQQFRSLDDLWSEVLA